MDNQTVDVKLDGENSIVIEFPKQSTVNQQKQEIPTLEKEADNTDNVTESKGQSVFKEDKKDEDADYTHLIPQEDYRTSSLFYEVANYFGVEQRGYDEAKDKLSLITDWVIMKTGSNKLEDVLPAIRELEDAIQRPAWGETRYGNFYRYLRIMMQKEKVDKILGAYEKKSESQISI